MQWQQYGHNKVGFQRTTTTAYLLKYKKVRNFHGCVMICLLSFDRNWKIGKYVHYTYFEGIPRERKETYNPTTVISGFYAIVLFDNDGH